MPLCELSERVPWESQHIIWGQPLILLSLSNTMFFPSLNTLVYFIRPHAGNDFCALNSHISIATLLPKGWIISTSYYGSRCPWATWGKVSCLPCPWLPSHSTQHVTTTQQMFTKWTKVFRRFLPLEWGVLASMDELKRSHKPFEIIFKFIQSMHICCLGKRVHSFN